MPTRTYLTTPPGREPSEATGRSASEDRERYVPGLAAPVEPRVPSRWRGPLLVVASAALVVLATITVLRLSAASQAQDPALDPALGGDPATSEEDPAGEGPSLRDGVPALPTEGLPGDG